MTKHEKFFETVISWHKALEKPGSDKVVIGDTDYASILYKKARAYEKLGFLYLARKSYKEVLKKEPQHTLAKKHFKTYKKIQESYKLETIQKNVQQFITFEGLQNKETKTSILKEMEKTEYGNLVKQFAYKKTEEELKSLVIILNDLGYLTTKLGDLSETMEGELNVKLKYYTDAAIFYQYVITIINEKFNKITAEDKMAFITQQKIYPQEQLSHLQELIFSTIVGAQESMPFFQQEKDSSKQSLKKLRNDINQKLQRAENIRKQAINNQEEKQKYQGLYVKEVINLFESIADEMRKFLGKLYSVSEQEIGRPPCKYAVIGLGSMALRQITPYSDLEFAILTENEDYKQSKDPKIKEYFKNLSHLVHFKVINLGESVIPTTRFSVDTSHLVRRGVNFDLGGKTPLGRIDNDKEYELVKTIDGMLVYVRNENNKAEHIDKNLPYILENVCYVHGDEQLVTSYKKEVTKFLTSKHESDEQGRLNCEIRALKLLEEGMIEIDYLQQTTSLNLKVTHFEGDLHRLAPKLGVENEGKLFDVKQEIYRLPDRLVYNLALYYGVEGDSNWDIVDKLKDENIISPEAAFNLKNAITFATTLRLKTYSYHKAQKEDMSIFSKSPNTNSEIKKHAKQIFHLSEDDLNEQGGLFQFFYVLLPLYERLKAFCVNYKILGIADSQTLFQDFYRDDHANKGLIYYRLAQYKKAQSCLELALNEQKYYNNLTLQSTLGICYSTVNDYDGAIKWFESCLKNLKLTYQDVPNPDVAFSLLNLGIAYCAKGKYDQAIIYYKDCLNMMKLIYKEEPHQDLARLFNSLGSVYFAKGEYDQARMYFEDCLNMMKLIYKENPDLDEAHTLNNLGLAYSAEGQYDKAIKYLEDSLKLEKLIYKKEPHPNVANSLNNLGSANYAKGQYDQANKYFDEAFEMKKLIYKDEPYRDVANSLNNLGSIYYIKEQYDQAITYYEDSRKIKKLIYKEEPHPDVASSLDNLGLAYIAKGQYDQAIEFFENTLEMEKEIYKEKPHPNMANSLNNLGLAYYAKKKYDLAIKYYMYSLKMKKQIFKVEPHLDVARTLSHLGCAYGAKGQYDQANKYFDKTLKMFKLILKDDPHPDVAGCFNNLGIVYKAKGQYDEAIKYFVDSLSMMKRIYKEGTHQDLANTLNNLGSAYGAIGKYDQAIKIHEDSLKIMKLIYNEEPHLDVAYTLTNLGLAYSAKDQYDKAIKFHKDSLKMMKLIFKEEPHLGLAHIYNNLGLAYKAKGQYDKAIKYHEYSLKSKKLIYKKEPHPDVVSSFNNLGSANYDKGQYEQANKYFDEALKMVKLIYMDEPHQETAKSLANLGSVYYIKELYDQAFEYFENALKMMKLIYKEKHHPDVADCFNNLGIAYKAKGQYDEAIKYFVDSLNMMKLIYKEVPYSRVTTILNNIGLAYSAKGQHDQAIKYHKESLKMKKIIYKGEPHPDVACSLINLGNAYHDNGQYDLAIKYGIQALQIISFFKDHPFVNLIKIDVLNTYLLYVKSYSLDSKEISDKLIELTGESYHNIELWRAVEESDLHKMQELITAGVDLDYMPLMTTATTPLIRAIVKGNVEMVGLVLENANINKPNNDGNKASPLYYSLGFGGQPINLEIVKLLLEKGADVSLAMYDGDTPMHMAHYKGNKEAIKLLLSCKAKVNVENYEGKTPLHCLLEKENLSTETKLEIINELYQVCDDKTIKDQEGNVVINSTQYNSLKLELIFNSNVVV